MADESPKRSGPPWTLVKILAGANALLIVIVVFLGIRLCRFETVAEPVPSPAEGTREPKREPIKVTVTHEDTTSVVKAAKPRTPARPVNRPVDVRPATPEQIADALNGAKEAATLSRMRRISTMLQMHIAESDDVPTDLAPLGLTPEELADAWGGAIRYERTGPRAYRLVSGGPDGQFSRADDLVCVDGRFERLSNRPQITK